MIRMKNSVSNHFWESCLNPYLKRDCFRVVVLTETEREERRENGRSEVGRYGVYPMYRDRNRAVSEIGN